MMETPLSKKQHYHLLATEVAFLEPENEMIGAFKVNVMMRTPTRNFTVKDLGKAQQIAQMQMFDKLQNEKLEVKDVFILSVSYLGLMNEEEFQRPPEGTKLQERPQVVPKTVFD